jgi:hypothetical protein
MRQADADLFGYLSYGRLFFESGAIARNDPFAYTSHGFEWVSFEYGAQLLLWLSYRFGGAVGLIALKCVAGGLTLALLWRALHVACDEPRVWLPVFLLCASGISRFFLFRPQIFTFAAFAAFVLVLFQHLLERRAPLWLLPLITLVWANMHGGFVAGLGAVGLAIALKVSTNLVTRTGRVSLFAGTGRLWGTLVACATASLANPHGLRLWEYVVHELTHDTNRRYIAEWAPASLALDVWSLAVLSLLTATLVFVSFMPRWRDWIHPGPTPALWMFSCVPLLAMSYLSVRHLPLAALWTAPVVALLASGRATAQPVSRVWRSAWSGISAISVIPASLTLGIVLRNPQPAVGPGGHGLGTTNPCGVTRFMAERHLQGNLFTPLWWGSYITWRLYPDIRVSMDGRNVSLYPDEMVQENLKFYWIDATEANLQAPSQYATDLLLVPVDVPVFHLISRDPRWIPIYRDRDSALFVPASAGDSQRSAFTLLSKRVSCDPL